MPDGDRRRGIFYHRRGRSRLGTAKLSGRGADRPRGRQHAVWAAQDRGQKEADRMKFAHSFLVERSDIDEQGHVNNVTYLRWIQDVAVAHWRHSASKEQLAKYSWV